MKILKINIVNKYRQGYYSETNNKHFKSKNNPSFRGNNNLKALRFQILELGISETWLVNNEHLLKKISKDKKLQELAFDSIKQIIKNFFFKSEAIKVSETLLTNTNPIDLLCEYNSINNLISAKVSESHINTIISNSKNDKYPYTPNELLDFRNTVIEHKDLLKQANKEFTISEIDNLLFTSPSATMNMLDIIGEEAFIYSLRDKYDCVAEYIRIMKYGFDNAKVKTEFIKRINPQEKDEEFKKINTKIKELKNFYNQISDKETLNQLKKDINTLTKQRNNILQNIIKDPKDILELALITAHLKNYPDDAIEIIHSFSKKTNNKNLYYEKLNQKLYNSYGINQPSKRVLEILNFRDEKHLPALYKARDEFKKEFKNLVELLEKNPDKSVKTILDKLPQNIQTKKLFKEINIDYAAWTNFSPKSLVRIKDSKGNDTSLTVQKADLYNLKHAIFLGDDAACCTRIGRFRDESAITYLKNKMFTAIEILDNGSSVGNSICYIALVNDIPSLIIDNIELKEQYRFNDDIREGIFKYAQQLIKEIGNPELHIYISARKQKINTDNLTPNMYKLEIIGNSGEDSVYIDIENDTITLNNYTKFISSAPLYPIKNTPKTYPEFNHLQNS